MLVKFIGGIRHLTGSCTWLNQEDQSVQLLVDCGLYQGSGEVETWNHKEFPFKPSELNFVLLTHAHIDHCGLIPKLYAEGFTGRVICTEATAKLATISLLDAAKINLGSPNPLFYKRDVESIKFDYIDNRSVFKWGKDIIISQNLSVTFLRSSHILGAAAIVVSWQLNESSPMKSMHFSGDIGNNSDQSSYLPMLKNNQNPFHTTDYILVESTYGSNNRDVRYKSAENRLAMLDKVITKTLAVGGRVLIPTFAIQRSQEITLDLWAWVNRYIETNPVNQQGRPIKILINSPMIFKANRIFYEGLVKKLKGKPEKNQYLREDLEEYIQDKGDIKDDSKGLDFTTYLKWMFDTSGHDKKLNRLKYSSNAVEGDDPKVIFNCSNVYPLKDVDYDIVLASSGMCTGGPIIKFLKDNSAGTHTILLTGFQAANTPGSAFTSQAVNLLDDELTPIENGQVVADMSGFYSGHADQETLLDYLFTGVDNKRSKPATIFINHGLDESKTELKEAIETRSKSGIGRAIKSVHVAEVSDKWFDLNSGTYIQDRKDNLSSDARLTAVEEDLSDIKGLLKQLINIQRHQLAITLDSRERAILKGQAKSKKFK